MCLYIIFIPWHYRNMDVLSLNKDGVDMTLDGTLCSFVFQVLTYRSGKKLVFLAPSAICCGGHRNYIQRYSVATCKHNINPPY